MADEEEKDWPGERSKKLGIPLGEIGCPHCGVSCHGALLPVCSVCDQPYWSPEILQSLIPNNNPKTERPNNGYSKKSPHG